MSMFSRKKNKWNLFFPGYESLDDRGIVKVGEWVRPRQILALRIRTLAPRVLTPYERLLFDVLEQEPPTIRNTSFRVPEKTRGRILNVEVFPLNEDSVPKPSFNKTQDRVNRRTTFEKNYLFLFSKKRVFTSNLFQKKQIKKRGKKTYFGLNEIQFKFPKKTVIFPRNTINNIVLRENKTICQIQKAFFLYFNPFSILK